MSHSGLTPLTIRRAIALTAILSAAQGNARVVLLDENGSQKRGTARHIVRSPEDFSFLGNDDVRSGYLRITLQSGVDVTHKVADLIETLHVSFFIHDWSEDREVMRPAH
ncbi:hypothetical protein [Nocardia carnea]|uniref:hypothetical protein n=1 Tax=Nocardia carnea TaxID=37328 RepID=UPI002457F0E7|nr:hypothetical protein [Nocardia carnea]